MPLTNEERNYLELLGGNIVKKRKERGIKQKELSDILDIDDGSLRRIEFGRTNPTTMTLYNIASALEIELKELFDFEKDLNE
ncbi:MAG: helix-turn-helix transcriptional regulator [Flavobacteriaceae bacterium]|nr:helix-turn-helix transcriptional regulator [Flavobacteriaceae bacterium]